jgi:hypothetical protein
MQVFYSFITSMHNSIHYCFSYNSLNFINLSNTMEMLNVKVLPKNAQLSMSTPQRHTGG